MSNIVIDCSGLTYKAFYALGNSLSYEDQQTGVIFQFLNTIFKLSESYNTNNFYFCWDSVKSKRKKIYPDYKGNRSKKELSNEEKENLKFLYSQMDLLRTEILPKLGFNNNFIKTGYEADDLIAYTVQNLKDCIVISSDKDLYQLLDYCDISYGDKYLTKKDFVEFYGIEPKEWIKAKAIGGCNSDNVKGVVGVADPAKSNSSKAISFLKKELTKGVIYEKIIASEDLINKNIPLVSLPFNNDLELELISNNFELDNWIEVFDKYGFRSFLKKEVFFKLKKRFLL